MFDFPISEHGTCSLTQMAVNTLVEGYIGEQCFFIPLEDIRLIQSMDNYARFFFGEKKAMLKKSLNQIAERLDPGIFFRINRSQIVNTRYIEKVDQGPKHNLILKLQSGEELEVSTRQSVKFKNWNTF